MMTDPIADMLTRIRNASAVRKPEASLPFSKIKFAIAKIFEREGYLVKAERAVSASRHEELRLVLKYLEGNKPAIQGIERVSRPGCRIYAPKDELPRVLSGYGLAIISTSKGLMTNKEARKQGLGGEVICKVW